MCVVHCSDKLASACKETHLLRRKLHCLDVRGQLQPHLLEQHLVALLELPDAWRCGAVEGMVHSAQQLWHCSHPERELCMLCWLHDDAK